MEEKEMNLSDSLSRKELLQLFLQWQWKHCPYGEADFDSINVFLKEIDCLKNQNAPEGSKMKCSLGVDYEVCHLNPLGKLGCLTCEKYR